MNYLHFAEFGIGSHAALQRIVSILLIIGLIATTCDLSTAIAEVSDKNEGGMAIMVTRGSLLGFKTLPIGQKSRLLNQPVSSERVW